MSRNLRSDVRTFSEPVSFHKLVETTVDRVVTTARGTTENDTYKAYANVLANRNVTNQPSFHSSTPEGEIKLHIRVPQGFDIIPQMTEVTIRNKEYVVTAVDAFSVNTESFFVYASSKEQAL